MDDRIWASEINQILGLQEEAKKLDIKSENLSDTAFDRIKLMSERIKKGGTTGDRIRDFVIARYTTVNPEIEKIYHDLETYILQNTGELVLTITRQENFHGCVGFGHDPRPEEYVLEENLCLGVLNGISLILDPTIDKCELPTGNFVKKHGGYWSNKLELVEGNIPITWGNDLWLNLNRTMELKNRTNALKSNLEFEIKFGDKEVKDWLKDSNEYENFKPMLSNLIPEE